MTPSTVRPAHSLPDSPGFVGRMSGLVRRVVDIAARVPDSAIALLGRFSIAAVFWKSGQTKIEGFAADSGEGRWTVNAAVDLGVPVPTISAALFARFVSQQEDSPTMKMVAAMRNQFGGHAVKAEGADGVPPHPTQASTAG